jgi:hypothetical protein
MGWEIITPVHPPSYSSTPYRLSTNIYSIHSQLSSIAGSHRFHLQPEDAPCRGDKGPTQQFRSYKNIINYERLQRVNLCFRNLPPGVEAEMVFSDMKYLLELLEPSEQNQTKFLRLQSIQDYNNITVETVMRRVSCISTILCYVSFRVAVFMCPLQNNAQGKRVIRSDLSAWCS